MTRRLNMKRQKNDLEARTVNSNDGVLNSQRTFEARNERISENRRFAARLEQ